MRNHENNLKLTVAGFLLFFITIAVTSSAAVLVFQLVNIKTGGNTYAIVLAVLTTILLGSILCTIFDLIRRKVMIETPVQMILDATKRIASGDFSIKLTPFHEYGKYDEYDLIFENINILSAELSKNELLKNNFISNVSHELKTPLAVIQNYAQCLQDPKLDETKKEEFLNGLKIQTKKLSQLITNILKLNKLENQQIVPEMESFDLAELLRVTTLQFESMFEKKSIDLICDIDEMKIISSSSMLEIVFNNLISNAIKFTENGGRITISLKEQKGYAIISVQDTGCGISKEVGDHIFEKFYQGDTSHAMEGNGLGLALVKQVIDILGGEITIQSKIGVGSTFQIKLKKE